MSVLWQDERRRGLFVTPLLALTAWWAWSFLPPPAAPRRFAAERDVLTFWEADKCQKFFGISPGMMNGPARSRSSLPTPLVSEDFNRYGRTNASHPPHAAVEVIVNHRFKFVYIEMRKTGSSNVRGILENLFHSSFWECEEAANCCVLPDRRFSSLCLNRTIIENYFFFSFVRHPLDRFYSQYKEAWKQLFWTTQPSIRVSHIHSVLQSIITEHDHQEIHLETMALSLSTPWALEVGTGRAHRVPLDYLGRMENFHDDFLRVLREISRRTTQQLPHIPARFFQNIWNPGLRTGELVRQHASAKIESMVRAAYAQDMACFGYS
jgi:hypothetical protein